DVPSNGDTHNSNAWILIVDNAGHIITNEVYGGTGNDDFLKALPTDDGNIALFGNSTSTDGDLSDFSVDSVNAWFMKIDSSGNILTNRVFSVSKHVAFVD